MTATTDEGEVMGRGDAYAQTALILSKISDALHKCDSSLKDVTRTRIFTTDISQWEAIGRAHGEAFQNVKPVTTMVEVRALIHPDMIVEIEATAIVTP